MQCYIFHILYELNFINLPIKLLKIIYQLFYGAVEGQEYRWLMATLDSLKCRPCFL